MVSEQEVRTQLKARVVDYEIDRRAAARPQLVEQRDDGRRVVGEQLRIRVGEDLVEGVGRRRDAGVGGPEAEVHGLPQRAIERNSADASPSAMTGPSRSASASSDDAAERSPADLALAKTS